MTHHCLSTEEFNEASQVFAQCYQITYARLSELEKSKVTFWIYKQISVINPCFSLRPDAMEEMLEGIFQIPEVRDFCLNLSFRFFTLCSVGTDFAKRLAGSLAEGLSCDGPNVSINTTPEEIKASMTTSVFAHLKESFKYTIRDKEFTLTSFLESNKHLMVVYMLYLTTDFTVTAPEA